MHSWRCLCRYTHWVLSQHVTKFFRWHITYNWRMVPTKICLPIYKYTYLSACLYISKLSAHPPLIDPSIFQMTHDIQLKNGANKICLPIYKYTYLSAFLYISKSSTHPLLIDPSILPQAQCIKTCQGQWQNEVYIINAHCPCKHTVIS